MNVYHWCYNSATICLFPVCFSLFSKKAGIPMLYGLVPMMADELMEILVRHIQLHFRCKGNHFATKTLELEMLIVFQAFPCSAPSKSVLQEKAMA